jgi:phospholipase/carboxylesterase
VVRIEWAEASRKALTSAGWKVEWHVYPMEHSAVMEEVAEIGRFLARMLA